MLLANNIERQLNTTRYAQLLINPEKIVAHRVLTNAQLPRSLPVRHSLRYKICDFILSPGKQVPPLRVNYAQRGGIDQGLQDEMQLVAVGPDLSVVHSAARNPQTIRPANSRSPA